MGVRLYAATARKRSSRPAGDPSAQRNGRLPSMSPRRRALTRVCIVETPDSSTLGGGEPAIPGSDDTAPVAMDEAHLAAACRTVNSIPSAPVSSRGSKIGRGRARAPFWASPRTALPTSPPASAFPPSPTSWRPPRTKGRWSDSGKVESVGRPAGQDTFLATLQTRIRGRLHALKRGPKPKDEGATAAVKLLGRGRDGDCSAPPAEIQACGFPAPGSCRRSDVIVCEAFSSARNLDPCATRFGGMPIPVLRPGLA